MKNLKTSIKVIQAMLWVSLIVFGITLINTTGMLFTSDNMIADVYLKKSETKTLDEGVLNANSGILSFKSENIIDKLLFKHVYGYHDFLQSLFTFIVCGLVLMMVRNLNLEHPFTISMAKRISCVGLLYISYGLMVILAALYMTYRIEGVSQDVRSAYSTFRDDLSNIKIGVFVMIFSIIYRAGVHFQEENRLTV